MILLSGFFSGSETALISLNKLQIEHLVRKKRKGIEIVKALKDKPNDLLITILIGNNIVNIGASTFATTIALGLFENNVIGITTGVMTFLILTFGEIIPKNLALNYNVKFSVFAAKPLYLLHIILYPLIRFYNLFNKLFKGKERPLVTEEEIKSFVAVGQRVGQIKETEKELIHRIFRFDDVSVREIMTPKPDMVILNSKDKIENHVTFFTKTPHSRIPIYEKTKENIIGIVHIKDVVNAIQKKKINKTLKSLMKTAFFVPETKKIDTLLKQFQVRNHHLAIVADEHGVITGLVTLEDVLEEIVGEIQDETDKIEPDIERLHSNKWKIEGRADIKDINKRLKIRLKEHVDFETFGGYILHELGRIPKQGETVKIKSIKIRIARKTGQRILDTIVWKNK